MTGTQVLVVCTVITTVIAAVVFVQRTLSANRDREAKEREARDTRDQMCFDRGVASRAPVEERLRDLLTAAEKRADKAETRVQQLEDRLGGI